MGERQKVTLDFFSEGFTNALRWEIIEKYNVTHILYRNDRIEPGVPMMLKGLGEEIDIDDVLIFIPIDFAKKPPEKTEEGQKQK